MQLSTISCPFVILTSSGAKHPIYLGPSVSVILPHSDFAPTQAWHRSAFAAGWFRHSGGASLCIKYNPRGRLRRRPFCFCHPPCPGWLGRHPGEGIQFHFRSCSSWRERQTDGLFHPDYPDFLNLEIHALKKCKLPKGVAKHVPGCANECKWMSSARLAAQSHRSGSMLFPLSLFYFITVFSSSEAVLASLCSHVDY